jgi:type I restriction enzyme S subunit
MKLPDGWEIDYLDNVTKRGSGHTPNQKYSEYWNGGIKWISLADSSRLDRRSIASTTKEISEEGLNNSSAVLHPKGTVLMSRDAGVGKSSIMECDMAVSQHFITWECKSKNIIDNLFLYYWLQAKKGYFERQAVGSTIKTIGLPLFKKLKLSYPPLPEQKAIADLLSTWDEAIGKTERLIQAKEKRFKRNIQKLIDLRCTEWTHVKPKNMFDIITEKNFPDEELLSVTQDQGVIPRNMREGRVMSPDGTTANYKLIKSGDFAISLRSFQGGIEYSKYQGIISPAYTVLRPKIEIDTEFYRIFFKTYIFIEKYLNLAVIGIRDGKQISIPDFLSIKIPLPSLEEQKQIAETLTTAQHEIDLLKQLAEKYKIQKRGLMQKMLTGEWRVKEEIIKQYTEA